MYEYKKEPIRGYEEYHVDTNGTIYNKNGSIKKYSLNSKGYCIVNFIINGKRIGAQIHRLVALQFIPNPNNLPEVNHKDGNKQNNNIANLEWCTAKENICHSYNMLHRESTNTKKIIGVDRSTKDIVYEFSSLADAGRYFSNDKNYRFYQNSIFRALNGIRKTYKGCYWKYVDICE